MPVKRTTLLTRLINNREAKVGADKAQAVKLYQEDMLTLSKAARLADMPIDQFVAVLGATGISVIGYGADDLQQELDRF